MLFSPVAPAPSLADAAVFCLIFCLVFLFSKHKLLNNARKIFPTPNVLDYVPVLFFYGFMQTAFDFKQAADLRSIRDRLSVQFERIPDGERLDLIDQFVHAFLGSRTRGQISSNAFERLKRHYQTWDEVADAPAADIEALIQDVIFPERKAPDLKQALV